jgi:hypothetical protein
LQAGFLVEAQFSGAGKPVVAADLGTAIAAAECDADELYLVRGYFRERLFVDVLF